MITSFLHNPLLFVFSMSTYFSSTSSSSYKKKNKQRTSVHECTLLNANKKCPAHLSRNINHIINSKQTKYEVRRILINSKHTFEWYSYNLYTMLC